jgi:hypothetical protein
MLAQHLTIGGIVDMAYQREPDPLLWAVRADGVLLLVTLDRDENVVAFARRLTDGLYESVAVVPTDDGEQAYAVVQRTINSVTKRYVERFDPTVQTDCAVLGVSGPGAATWSGLGHLEGESVDVVADGSVMPAEVVTGGAITIERDAFEIEIGLHYKTTIALLPPEVAGMTTQGNMVRQAEITVRFLETSGAEVEGEVIPFRSFGADLLDEPIAAFSGDKRINRLGWDRSGAGITIVQDQPLPLHVLSVIQKLSINEG